MGTGFVLTGPAPAAREFLSQIVLAIVSGDPNVSDKVIEGACIAVGSLPGLTEIERRQVLLSQLSKLQVAGLYRDTVPPRNDAVDAMVDGLSTALQNGAQRNRARKPAGAKGPWHRGPF